MSIDAHSLNLTRQGVAHHRGGRFREAEKYYQHALRLDARNAEALNLMGVLACEAKRYRIATDYLSQAIALDKQNAVFRCNFGNALILAERPEEALSHLKQAIRLKPDLVEAHANLGRAYRRLSRAEKALACLERAASLDPKRLQTQVVLGEVLSDLGRLDEAVVVFRRLLAAHPTLPQALAGLATAKRFTTEDPELATIEAVIAKLADGDPMLEVLHHAAGKIYNDLSDYDKAFDHFEKGKALSGKSFDIALHIQRVDMLVELFNAGFFLGRKGREAQGPVPVFVVGMPRSGTTLIEQILSSHPEVHGAGELPYMRRMAKDLGLADSNPRIFAERVRALESHDIARMAASYMSKAQEGAGTASRIVDKMPHNFELLGLIWLLFPNARIVHALRDPLDNCVSCFTNLFNEFHGYNSDLVKLGAYYRQYWRLMEHWRGVLPLPLHPSKYEELIGDPEGNSRRLVDFVGLDWDPRCLTFYENERSVRTISRWQVRQPIYASSVKRWEKYRHRLGPLISSLGDLAAAL